LSATDTNERIWTEGVTAPRVILLFLERSFEPPADDACSTGARGAIILQVLLQNLNPGQDTREQATTYLELYSKCHSCKAHRTTVLRSVGARSSKCCRASFSDFRSRVKGGASQSHLTVRRATYLDGLSSTVVKRTVYLVDPTVAAIAWRCGAWTVIIGTAHICSSHRIPGTVQRKPPERRGLAPCTYYILYTYTIWCMHMHIHIHLPVNLHSHITQYDVCRMYTVR
jgi:hypothetical protein